MSSSQKKIGWEGSHDGQGQDQRSVPGYVDTICKKTSIDRGHVPLQLGIALASQCLLSYRRGMDDCVVGAALSRAEVRTLEHGGGYDASPTARSFRCRSPLDAGNGLDAVAQKAPGACNLQH